MPKIQFNPSEIPLWRKRPKRLESPIKAYRCWRLYEDFDMSKRSMYFLSSITMGTVWEGPVLRADVKPFDTEVWDQYRTDRGTEFYQVPCRTWDSGIYALDTKEYAIETARIYSAQVIGQVDLWGRVVVFDRGYRAELCMIKKLWVLYHNSGEQLQDFGSGLCPMSSIKQVVPDLARTYDCDVEVL